MQKEFPFKEQSCETALLKIRINKFLYQSDKTSNLTVLTFFSGQVTSKTSPETTGKVECLHIIFLCLKSE